MPRPTRFPNPVVHHLRLDASLRDAFMERCEADGRNGAEVIRRLLAWYARTGQLPPEQLATDASGGAK